MGLIKMNGVNYWGSAYGQGIIAPMIYSEEEIEVGVWTDGKPLYQRSIEQSSTNVSGTEVQVDLSSWNIDECVEVSGFFDRVASGNKSTYYFNSREFGASNEYWGFAKYHNANKYLAFSIKLTSSTTSKQVITLLYTKTTDTAGSGTYTPSKALAVHYSTTERVIGTWIDGKPLYEKVFTISEVTVSANSWYEITSIDTSNISQLVSNKCLLTRNGMEWGLLSTQKSGNNKLNVLNSRNANIAFDTIVLQYTKTTD